MADDQQTNGNVIDEVLKQGPLSSEEVARRAKILVYNELGDMFERQMAHLLTHQKTHPETRQVIAMSAEFINDLATEILVELESAEREEKENQ